MKKNRMTSPVHIAPSTSPSMKNKQRGAMLLDNLLSVGFVAALLIGVITSLPAINYKLNLVKFIKQESTINGAVSDWKKGRPNFQLVTMTKLCERQLLDKSICGAAGDGKAANAFGGDWTVKGIAGHYEITATLENLDGETGRLFDVADSLAPSTRLQCASSDSCGSIRGAGTKTLTMVH